MLYPCQDRGAVPQDSRAVLSTDQTVSGIARKPARSRAPPSCWPDTAQQVLTDQSLLEPYHLD